MASNNVISENITNFESPVSAPAPERAFLNVIQHFWSCCVITEANFEKKRKTALEILKSFRTKHFSWKSLQV